MMKVGKFLKTFGVAAMVGVAGVAMCACGPKKKDPVPPVEPEFVSCSQDVASGYVCEKIETVSLPKYEYKWNLTGTPVDGGTYLQENTMYLEIGDDVIASGVTTITESDAEGTFYSEQKNYVKEGVTYIEGREKHDDGQWGTPQRYSMQDDAVVEMFTAQPVIELVGNIFENIGTLVKVGTANGYAFEQKIDDNSVEYRLTINSDALTETLMSSITTITERTGAEDKTFEDVVITIGFIDDEFEYVEIEYGYTDEGEDPSLLASHAVLSLRTYGGTITLPNNLNTDVFPDESTLYE